MVGEADLKTIAEFHGHLGPFVVLGYRMGLLANRLLGSSPFGKSATVYTMTSPPRSCVIDGIQLSSGCTLGKGNIAVTCDEEQVASLFESVDGRGSVMIRLRDELLSRIIASPKERNENLAMELYHMPDEYLFHQTQEG